MKQIKTAALGALCLAGLAACKKDFNHNNPVVSETRVLESFQQLSLQMNGNVYYHLDAAPGVEILAAQHTLAKLQTQVINGELLLRYADGDGYGNDEQVTIHVYGPDLSRIENKVSGNIYCLSDLHTDQLELRTLESGSIQLKNIEVNSLDAVSKGSGNISAQGGSAIQENLVARESGSIDVSELLCHSVMANTQAAGNILVNASQQLNAIIEGSGSVYFSGFPLISTQISGSGRLIRL